MSSSSTSGSPSSISFSSSQAGGKTLLPLEASDNFGRWSSNSLPPSPFPTYSWDVEEARYSDEDYEFSSSSSASESLLLDSPPPSPSDLPESPLKSVFEDWDTDPIPSLGIPTIIIQEEDGAQTVIIDSQSPFFSPPTLPSSSGNAVSRFLDFPPERMARRGATAHRVPANVVSSCSSSTSESRLSREQLDQPMKDQMLFVLTASLQGGFALSSSLLYSLQPVDKAEVASWAPRGLMYGPDVPLDCSYRSREVSPAEHWDETPWSLRHTAPLNSAF